MVCCKSEVEAWLVRYYYHGMPSKMISLDKVKADAYAVQYHGIVSPMYSPIDNQPAKQELDTNGMTTTGNLAPWDGETELGAL